MASVYSKRAAVKYNIHINVVPDFCLFIYKFISERFTTVQPFPFLSLWKQELHIVDVGELFVRCEGTGSVSVEGKIVSDMFVYGLQL